MTDRAVFASGVHRLKNDEDRTLALGIEQVLEIGQLFEVLLHLFRSRLFVGSSDCLIGVPLRQDDMTI